MGIEHRVKYDKKSAESKHSTCSRDTRKRQVITYLNNVTETHRNFRLNEGS